MLLPDNPSLKQSRKLAKELGKAAEIFGKGKNGLGFGKVDITKETELQQEFDITHAPELKLFFEGNRLKPISCKGNGDWGSSDPMSMGSHWQAVQGWMWETLVHMPFMT